MTPQRERILTEVRHVGEITPARAGRLIGYYHNGAKHGGALLSRMVASGLLVRSGKGVYVLPPKVSEPQTLTLE
jgi:hypothetical protein